MIFQVIVWVSMQKWRGRVLFTFIICFIAATGAGLGNGLAGLSATAVISPMLITYLHYPAYQAIGIGLATDVISSGVTAYQYQKSKNVDIRHGAIMLATMLFFTLLGSYIASLVSNNTMGGFSKIMTLLVGINFLTRKEKKTKEAKSQQNKIIKVVISGALLGFMCGFLGTGGGVMILVTLTGLLGYEMKMAVGTSVFIMVFTAFTGAVTHFIVGGIPDLKILATCVTVTFIWALIGSKWASKADDRKLNKVAGTMLCVLALVMMLVK